MKNSLKNITLSTKQKIFVSISLLLIMLSFVPFGGYPSGIELLMVDHSNYKAFLEFIYVYGSPGRPLDGGLYETLIPLNAFIILSGAILATFIFIYYVLSAIEFLLPTKSNKEEKK